MFNTLILWATNEESYIHPIGWELIGATLAQWSESLQISTTCSLGHTESISYKKTHGHQT